LFGKIEMEIRWDRIEEESGEGLENNRGGGKDLEGVPRLASHELEGAVEEGSGVAEGGAIVVDDHNVQELRPAGHGAALACGRKREGRGRSGEQKKGRVFDLLLFGRRLLLVSLGRSVVRDTTPHTVDKLVGPATLVLYHGPPMWESLLVVRSTK
jgi:hypothetical protein